MSLFQELQRRNIFKVAGAYLVVGWLLVESSGTIAPMLGLTGDIPRIILLLVIVGFPLVLIYAWLFEVTPDGIKRTKEVSPDNSVTTSTGNKINYITMLLVAIGLVFYIYQQNLVEPTSESLSANMAENINANSIAVLPFADMSPEGDQKYFADGISEEILNLLAQIPDLHVTSRSSAFQFRGDNIHIPTVADQLGVNNVLEGSIRTQGKRVRITAQLIDANSDKHLWSETYTRDLTDIFEVQDEIASSILSSLRIHLLGESVPENIIKTDNVEAYNAYLIGRERMSNQTKADIEVAKNKFYEVTKLDPNFASAHAQLLLASLELERFSKPGKDRDSLIAETDALAKDHLAIANQLDPDHFEIAAIDGYYNLKRYSYDKAAELLDKAISLNPSFAQGYLWRADVYYHNNQFGEMLADREKAYQLDPMSLEISRELAYDYRSFWRPDDADRIIQTMFDLHPDHRDAYTAKISNLAAHGRYGETLVEVERALALYPDDQRLKNSLGWASLSAGELEIAKLLDIDWVNYEAAMISGQMDVAENILNKILTSNPADYNYEMAAGFYYIKNNKEKVAEMLTARIKLQEEQGYPWREHCKLWTIEYMRFAGMTDGTETMMADCRQQTEERVASGYLCPCSWFNLVAFAVLESRYDDAIVRTQEWLDAGDSSYDFDYNPFLNKLKDQPEYEVLRQQNFDQIARQRRIYQAGRTAQN